MRINRNVSVPPTPPQAQARPAEVIALRQNWKWAYLSHFLFTYNPVLHLEDIPLSELEDDLAAGTCNVISTVIQRLLMCLTPHDKKLILEDWQHQFRKQSSKRDPQNCLLGDDSEPVEFDSLIMTDKLDVFHSLCEWQFHNSVSLRHRMRNDDEEAHWRIEPIAYDAKGNAYWLLGGNRLWKQHAPSRKRPAPSKKRKQPSTATSNGRKSAKRKRAAQSLPKSKAVPVPCPPKPSRKPLKPIRETRSHAAGLVQTRSRPLGTRVSSRLRGKDSEDEWQSIPDEWLKDAEENGEENGLRRSKRKGREADTTAAEAVLNDVSDLTSLSELSDMPEMDEEEEEEEAEEDSSEAEEEEEEEVKEEEESTPPLELDFSTPDKEVWETVCVTIEEWEEFPKQFENSRYKIEKNFYKLLVNDLVPAIVEVLKEVMRKNIIVQEPTIVERKRSSRLAVKESIKEAERDAARKKAEEEKEMERHKRWEARARKEEDDRLKRENMRSARIREKAKLERGESAEIDIVGGVDYNKPATNGITVGLPTASTNPIKSGTLTPKEDEPWELDCEICLRSGVNLDGDQQLLSCERCNKWQHIRCHDEADLIAGRKQRNWDKEEFVCSTCRAKDRAPPQVPKLPLHPQNWPISPYNGVVPAMVPINGTAAPKDSGATPQQRPLKAAAAPTIAYSNGLPIYAAPQNHDPHHYSTTQTKQYQYRPQVPAAASSRVAYTATTGTAPPPVPSQGRPPLPYSTAPNMYMSTYLGGVQRSPQTATPSQSPPQQSHYRSTPVVIPAPHAPQSGAGAWPQQQSQTWSTSTTGGTGTQPYGSTPMANGYRPHVYTEMAVPASTGAGAAYHRPPPQSHVPPAQPQYYNRGGS